MTAKPQKRLRLILAWVGIIAGALLVVGVIFISGFVVGRNEMTTSVAPAANQPLYCQAKCIGETNVSYQSWIDCINRCMSPGGIG